MVELAATLNCIARCATSVNHCTGISANIAANAVTAPMRCDATVNSASNKRLHSGLLSIFVHNNTSNTLAAHARATELPHSSYKLSDGASRAHSLRIYPSELPLISDEIAYRNDGGAVSNTSFDSPTTTPAQRASSTCVLINTSTPVGPNTSRVTASCERNPNGDGTTE